MPAQQVRAVALGVVTYDALKPGIWGSEGVGFRQ